jgi:hypothetical protein
MATIANRIEEVGHGRLRILIVGAGIARTTLAALRGEPSIFGVAGAARR